MSHSEEQEQGIEPYGRKQRYALWIAIGCGLLALLTGTGCGPIPVGEPEWVAWLHPFLVLWGAVFGMLALGRQREVEARRQLWAMDLDLTVAERKWAHKEAESESIRAGATFLAAAVLLAGWLSYQFRADVRNLVVDLLPATAFVGFVIGLVGAYLRNPRVDSSEAASEPLEYPEVES